MSARILVTAAALALALGNAPAHAHAFLSKASPAVGSSLGTPPTEVRIDFTEGVEPSFSRIVVTDQVGDRVDDGKPAHLEGGDSTLVVGLKPLKPGRYKVSWHAVATDTHHTQGTYLFTITP